MPLLNDVNLDEVDAALTSAVDFVRWGTSLFNAAELTFAHGTDNATDEALALVLHALALDPDVPDQLLAGALLRSEKARIVDLFTRRIRERVPAAYLTRSAWFAGLELYVDERVLIPRSPIAELIGHGFAPWAGQVRSVLDLGTGSGAIAIACAEAFPDAIVDAVDVSDDVLEVARINVARFGVEDRVRTVRSDFFADLEPFHYDVIVSNPPYVAESRMTELPPEHGHEPALALQSGPDGLDAARAILAAAPDWLSDSGILVLEVGESGPALERALAGAPVTWAELEDGGEGIAVFTREDLRDLGDVGVR